MGANTSAGPTPAVLHQAGALVYRVVSGELLLLMLTSRETARWIIPKGNIDPGLTAAQAAQMEVLEEAGLEGVVEGEIPIGSYFYRKRLKSGSLRPTVVEVYLIRATKQRTKWLEKGERRVAWVSIAEAQERLGEPALAPLFERLAEIEPTLVERRRGKF